MEYLVVVSVLIVIFGLYVGSYLLNLRVNKPNNCKDIECDGCNLKCNKRSEK